jgi:hypothetical protein
MSINKEAELARYKRYAETHKEQRAEYRKKYRVLNSAKLKDPLVQERARIKARELYQRNKQTLRKKYLLQKSDLAYQAKQKLLRSTPEAKQRQRDYYRKRFADPAVRAANLARIKEYQKTYKIVKKDYLAKKRAEYYSRYREKSKTLRTTPEARARRNQRIAERRKTDFKFRFATSLRQRTTTEFKKRHVKQTLRTKELFGKSMPETMKYIESLLQPGMKWINHTFYGWHVDHIVPCAAFDLKDINQQKACFHYTNLQPIWYVENLDKRDYLPPLSALPPNSPAYPYLVEFHKDPNRIKL